MNEFTKEDLLAFLAAAKQAARVEITRAVSAGIGTIEDGAMLMRMFDRIAKIVEEYGTYVSGGERAIEKRMRAEKSRAEKSRTEKERTK